ncbi:g3842 [Coccomyxa viridis]|uniref:G3842 protein n=1 Tax=Coccomyxa viridis TaxID=1274662 RepID=A0ABP1FNS3_9CHLO
MRSSSRKLVQWPSQNGHHLGRRRVRYCSASASTATELPAELKKIVDLFNMVPDAKLKYQQLLSYGKKLPPMPQEDHTDENKVRGCVSQVWVKPQVRDGKIYWLADSDSALTKGLAALLVQGLSGCKPEEVAHLTPDWITRIGLQQSLTPSRNNGFLNMFGLMRHKAAQLLDGQVTEEALNESVPEESVVESAPLETSASGSSRLNGAMAAAEADGKPVRASMQRKLTEALQPQQLTVVDESDQHAGHAGSRMLGNTSGETHFRISIVSQAFDGLNTVKRHRMVYAVLKDELAGPVHALSLDTKTEPEASS